MRKTPKQLHVNEAWGLASGWQLIECPPDAPERSLASGSRKDLIRIAQRLAMEEKTLILVFDASRTVVEAFESIDCREALEDGIQARGVITDQGHIRHIVVPIDPATVRLD